MQPLQNIMRELSELSGGEVKQLVTTRDRIVAAHNFNHLNPEERCNFIYGLVNLPIDEIRSLTSLNQDAKNKLQHLRSTGLKKVSESSPLCLVSI